MKTTQKEIRNMVNAGIATDITYFQFSDIEQLRKAEKWFTEVAYAAGIYGCNAVLLKGHESGNLYAITSRTPALFQIG